MFTDEQDIECTLKETLNVEPSDGFEARVRQRLQHEMPARRFAAPAWLAAAAAVVLLAGGWYLAARDSSPASPVTVADNVPRPDPPVAPVVTPAPAAEVAAIRPAAPRPAPSPAAASAARRPEPEVIVPANQLEMLERLLRNVHTGRVAFPESPAHLAEAPAALDIAPVVVDPIPLTSLTVPDVASKGLH